MSRLRADNNYSFKEMIWHSFEEAYRLRPLKEYVASLILSIILSGAAFYSSYNYKELTDDQLVSKEYTFQKLKKIDEGNRIFMISTNELCGELSVGSVFRKAFRESVFNKYVNVGDKLSFKIKRSDLPKLDSCIKVDVYEIVGDKYIYLDIDKAKYYLDKNSGLWAPLVGFIFLFIALFFLSIIVFGRRAVNLTQKT